MTTERCRFCDALSSVKVQFETELFAVLEDPFATDSGVLVVLKRHVPSFFASSEQEQMALLNGAKAVREQLLRSGWDGARVVIDEEQRQVRDAHAHLYVYPTSSVGSPSGDQSAVVGTAVHEKSAAYVTTINAKGKGEPLVVGGKEDPFGKRLAPLFRGATGINIVSAFLMDRGLCLVENDLFAALEEKANVRLLTGDYLKVTQPAALKRLLHWQDIASGEGEEETDTGSFEARVVEVASLEHSAKTFHPKSWLFQRPEGGVAFVGSSNISGSALGEGIEWNLRVERARDRAAFDAISKAFDTLWKQALPLSFDWVSRYEKTYQPPSFAKSLTENDEELGGNGDEASSEHREASETQSAPQPRTIQQEALDALKHSRLAHHKRALVVLATGLGKTWLAAFDVRAFADEYQGELLSGRPRVLFLAHRKELLFQAMETFRRLFPKASFGLYVAQYNERSEQFVFASIQKFSNIDVLRELASDEFDYVIVDEIHHAAAKTYRRVLDWLDPAFLLGLTATPERADGADILSMMDDHLAFRADLGEGIQRELLCPFHYLGIKDTTDYEPIPWRNRRFDSLALSQALQTQERMERLWQAWQEHPGTSTIVFCSSISHADFVCQWLKERGVRVQAVYAKSGSANRTESIEKLTDGGLDALCAVDLLNEGVDIPRVDRVVMLRPTESAVIFLQQLGRGLRLHPDKEVLTVIDFVGNHKVFLMRLQSLLSLSQETVSVRGWLADAKKLVLPPGCRVEVELEAIDLLKHLLPKSDRDALVQVYRDLRATEGRPTASHMFHMGFKPNSGYIKKVGGWFGFLSEEGDLSVDEQAAYTQAKEWFLHLATSSMTKSFKMVTLLALLEEDSLLTGAPLRVVSKRSHQILLRSPVFFRELEGLKALPQPEAPQPAVWERYWRKNPIRAWTEGEWFSIEDECLVPRLGVFREPGVREAFEMMTRELVEWRLAQHKTRSKDTAEDFTTRVLSNGREPILKLPSRKKCAVPNGDVEVDLPNGDVWLFRFKKEYCNVAHPIGASKNQLGALLRGWFGEYAGMPGTRFSVRFLLRHDRWFAQPT